VLSGVPKKEIFSFHLISDIHFGLSNAAENFSAALDNMKEINPQAAALVITGDLTEKR
jgi:3',5'-cyclic AMP phosphodiesterase CpdA